jgi:subtilase family serine protease
MRWLGKGIGSFHSWFGKRSHNTRFTPPKLRFRPQLESLEDRTVPSTATTDFVLLHDAVLHNSAVHGAASTAATVPYSPQEIAAAYGINSITFSGGVAGNGAGQTIAIVDAYNDPNALSDLETYDAHFGLANPPSFTRINQSGQTTNLPGTDPTGGWEVEESLDIEMAHALAPDANIVLVEATSASTTNLFAAVQTAAKISGVSVVSMSWGMQGGFSGETSYDSLFNVTGVTFVASTGDNGSPGSYPAESPYVVAVGGTTLSMTNSTTYGSEVAWSDSGGGVSSYETRPAFQNGVSSVVGNSRGTPDVSFDANPNTGVYVYDSFDESATGGPWLGVGGTSAGAPSWAALIAIADQGRVSAGLAKLSSTQTLTALYSLPSSDFHDITSGSNGGYKAGVGYDLVTGLGTPVANLLVPALAGNSGTTSGGSGSSGTTGSGGSGSTSGGGSTGTGGGTGSSGTDYEVANVSGAGIYRYSEATGAWTQISTATTATSLAVDAQGDVIAELSGSGVWLYQNSTSTWEQLTTANASQVSIAGNGIVVGSFGNGVFNWQSSTGWVQLTSSVATNIAVDANGDVVGAFGNIGVWLYESSTGWVQLTTTRASQVAIANGIVAAEFGSGVWRWEASTGWEWLTSSAATSLGVDSSGDVVGAFGSLGVWRYENSTGWVQLSTSVANQVDMSTNVEIIADFATGVWLDQGSAGFVDILNKTCSLVGIGV